MTPKPARKQSIPHRGPLGQRAEIASSSRAFPRMKAESVPRAGWVREIRTALGLSQSQLAARAGVSRATVQQMEKAEARAASRASLDRLAAAMDCQVAIALVPKAARSRTCAGARRRCAPGALAEKIKDNKTPPRPKDLERRKAQLVTKLRGSRRRLWRPPKGDAHL